MTLFFDCDKLYSYQGDFATRARGGDTALVENFFIPLPPGKILPPVDSPLPLKINPRRNNNFLNCQNHSSSDSHHPIKNVPTALGKRIFLLPLKAILETLPTKFSVPEPKLHLQPKDTFCVA